MCSGIGGFHSGLVNTGHYRCVGHAEIDKNAEKAYNAIYGEEGGLNYGDLRTINPREQMNRQKIGVHVNLIFLFDAEDIQWYN